MDARHSVELKLQEVPSRIELRMSVLLRAGTLLSLALVMGGMALTFINHPDYFWSVEALDRITRPSAPHRLSDVVAGLAGARGRAVTMTGLLLLILLPVVRLAVAWAGFRAQADRTFSRISLVVLALVGMAFVLGGEG
jgi:uncharacterized membrane protein